jgi:hypothetical protein
LVNEQRHCSRDVLAAIAQAQNANGLTRYLARHEVCHGIDADHLLALLLTFDTSSPEHKRTMMTSLLKAGAHFDSSDWTLLQRARPDDIDLALDAVGGAADEASMSKQALEEVLMHIAYDNDTTNLNKFVAHGVRLDAAEWRDHGFYMLQRSLEKPDHSWKFFDALIEAGAQLDSALRALLHSMRTATIEPVQDWTPTDWMRLAAPGHDDSYTLAAFAALYAIDEPSRMEYLRIAKTNLRQLLAVTQQPALCDLIRIAEPHAALARLESMGTESLYPSCRQAMWDLRGRVPTTEPVR